jgi:hypothetical protein
VIGAADAKLIGATRVGDVELAAVANALGISDKVATNRVAGLSRCSLYG